jgi:beta-galactosidase
MGRGSASYISTRLGTDGLVGLLPQLPASAGVESGLSDPARGDVEQAVRRSADSRYLFLVNRTDESVPLPELTGELLVGQADTGSALVLAPREVAVLRQPAL